MRFSQFTLDDYNDVYADRHRLQDVVTKWAKAKPKAVALLSADGKRTVTWGEFDRVTAGLAREFLRLGFKKGDYLATVLPMTVDHVLLEYSCFKIGVIVAPLDLRLSVAEFTRVLEILRPRGFVSLGGNGPVDFSELWRAVKERCGWIEHLFTADSGDAVPGTHSFTSLAERAWKAARSEAGTQDARADLPSVADVEVTEDDGALVIFTTGSTGSPKAALLSHRNITVQNMCMCGAIFGMDSGLRTLVHLPPSHVGCQTEMTMSTLFGGGSVVLLEAFDAARTMRTVEQQRVQIFAQIPAMFSLVWMLKEYERYDLSSVKIVAFGGNSVSRAFVEKVAAMAPIVATGLGLTECAGFCTYLVDDSRDSEMLAGGVGMDMAVYPCTIREAMREDGYAGSEMQAGEIGHVCFRGPQTFLGYVNDPEATAKTISRDGFLYTGDMGYRNDAGLHLTGRAKWVIKSMGHQIFPGDVEAKIATLKEKVANCVVVGVAHEVVGEGAVALVEKKPDVVLNAQELDRHTRSLPAYMRPRHWIVLEPGKMPLNRVAKPDYLRAQEMAREEIAGLRSRGAWDSGYAKGGQE